MRKGKRTPRDHYFNKKEKQNQIPWPGRTLLGQHFWGSLNVSQVFQLILTFREAWDTLCDRNPLLFL